MPDVYGRIILVRIVASDKFYMRSEIVDSGPFDSLVPPSNDSSVPELTHLRPLVHNQRDVRSQNRSNETEKRISQKFTIYKMHWVSEIVFIVYSVSICTLPNDHCSLVFIRFVLSLELSLF